jgi:hypothetical protein
MRCMSCGAEMRVVQSDHDETMMVAGYVHQKLECTVCHEIETRLVFDPADAPPHPTAPTEVGPTVLEDERELDECEALLQHAIEMVRSPALIPQEASPPPPPEASPAAPAPSVRSLRAQMSGPSRFVRIRHAPGALAPYIAEDTSSGLSILRYTDSKHLREMCEWLGWQVIDEQVIDEQLIDEPVASAGA